MNRKAQKTIKLIEHEIAEGQTACLPDLVRIINTLSLNIQDLPVYQLTDLIQNDSVILHKVIAASNKVGYNPLSIPVTTLFGAIQLVGFDHIRSLTMALILLENSQKNKSSDERRHAAFLSLSAGLLTKRLALHTKYKVSEETAFICGALRGYGLIMLNTYFAEESKLAEELSRNLPREAAYQKVFGLTPLELSHHIMKSSKMPELIVNTLTDYEKPARGKHYKSEEHALMAISDFSYRLTQIALDQNINAEAYYKEISLLSANYDSVIEHNPDFYSTQLNNVHEYISKLRLNSVSSAFPENCFNCLKARFLSEEPPKTKAPVKEEIAILEVVTAEEPEVQFEGVHESNSFWQRSIDIMQGFDAADGLTVKAADQFLRIMQEGFGSDETWLFLPNEDSGLFHLHQSMGTYQMILGKRTAVQIAEPTVFGLCLKRKEIIVINNAKSEKVRNRLPEWYRSKVDLQAFVLCSIHDQAKPVGLIYIGWKDPKNFQIQPEKVALIRQIVARVAQLAS